MRQLWAKLAGPLTRLGSVRAALALITVEPAMLAFFMAIYFLYSAFQPLVYARLDNVTYLTSLNDVPVFFFIS
jgi:hypothetical protein